MGPENASTNTGAVWLSVGLDFDLSPGTAVGGDPALVYNSDTVQPRPVVEARLTGLDDGSVVRLRLTFNGVVQDWVTFAIVNPGEVTTLGAQVQTPVLDSGVYD